jgi:hypothetical protein
VISAAKEGGEAKRILKIPTRRRKAILNNLGPILLGYRYHIKVNLSNRWKKKLEVGGSLRLRFKAKGLLPLTLSPALQDDRHTSNYNYENAAECPVPPSAGWAGMNAAVLNSIRSLAKAGLSCPAFSPRLESLGYP